MFNFMDSIWSLKKLNGEKLKDQFKRLWQKGISHHKKASSNRLTSTAIPTPFSYFGTPDTNIKRLKEGKKCYTVYFFKFLICRNGPLESWLFI